MSSSGIQLAFPCLMNQKQKHSIAANMEVDELARTLLDQIDVNIIMARYESVSAWQDYSWELVGVTTSAGQARSEGTVTLVHQVALKQILYAGMPLRLHRDECESYYHNLKSPVPFCFVLTRRDDDDVPVPFLITLSVDEAHAYLEGDDEVYTVAIPAEIHQWLDAYVVANYVPATRQKRKQNSWKDTAQ